MRWPWQRTEDRAGGYSDLHAETLLARATGNVVASASATAAVEACASFVGRAFAAAQVDAPPLMQAALTPACMNMIGRALIRRGEIVLLIRVERGGVMLYPASSFDPLGGVDPATWRYRVTSGGPQELLTWKDVPAESVLHFRYATDPEDPWRGFGPLYAAKLAGRLSAETAAALADESAGPRAHFLPMPVDGKDPTTEALKRDIKKAKGETLTVQSGDWGEVGGAPNTSWQPRRLGAEPPSALVELHKVATAEIYAACGLNPAVFMAAQGTGGREAYRQALFGVVAPLGRMVETEMRAKLDPGVSLAWDELRAADIAGRARAFQSMVGAGMDPAKAAGLSGLMIDE